jgi:hypothetical protein
MLHKNYWGEHIERDERGEAYSANGEMRNVYKMSDG